MLLGTSIDINNPPTPRALKEIGFSAVRFVATTRLSHVEVAQRYIRAGIDISLVLTTEVFYKNRPDQWYDQTKQLIKLWRPSYLIVGNEPDGSPTEESASWIMTPSQFQHLLNIVQSARVEPYPEFVVGGLVSGQPTYLDQLTIPHYNALDIHPYAKQDPYPLLEEYSSYLHHPQYLTVGEFNTPADNLRYFLLQMEVAGVYIAYFFHYSYGPFALTDAHKAIIQEYTHDISFS